MLFSGLGTFLHLPSFKLQVSRGQNCTLTLEEASSSWILPEANKPGRKIQSLALSQATLQLMFHLEAPTELHHACGNKTFPSHLLQKRIRKAPPLFLLF